MSRLLSIAAGVHPDLAPVRMVEVAASAKWPACGVWFDAKTWTEATSRDVKRRLDETGVVALDIEPIIPAVDHDDQGERVIEGFRKMAGATDPTVAEAGTIRGDLARDMGTKVVQNIVHGSDSVESAQREIKIFFGN